MNHKERIIWTLTMVNLLVLCFFGGVYFYNYQESRIKDFQFLLRTYDAETNILEAQLADVINETEVRSSQSYQKGFEDGRTQAGIAFLYDGSLQDYGDGYHAALSQWGNDNPFIATMSDDEAVSLLMEILSKDNSNEKGLNEVSQ